MKELRRNIVIVLTLFVGAFIFLIGYFSFAVYFYGSRWFTQPYNPRIISEKQRVVPGDIIDRNGLKLAGTDDRGKRVYIKDRGIRQAVSHVVGDNMGITAAGVEAFHARYLLGFNNNVIERIYQTLFIPKQRGNNIILTIDGKLQEEALNKMRYNGAIVLMNYKTGEILVLGSKPLFDPANLEVDEDEDENEEKGNLVNRATQGQYTPGSVFKIITAASALRYIEGIDEREFDCSGSYEYNNVTVNDYQNKVHGTLDLSQAMAVSCNTTFAKLGVELGSKRLGKTAEDFGFNEDFLFKDLIVYNSSFNPSTSKDSGSIAWAAVGQDKDIVTPLHMAMIVSSIANKGVMMEPKLIKAVKNIRGYEFIRLQPQAFRKPVSEEVANKIKEMLFDVVKSGTAKSAMSKADKRIRNLKVAGKTGTAEVGEGKNKKNHAWFVGFIDSEEHPLAIAVVVENVNTTGGQEAAPIALDVLSDAVAEGY